MKGLVGLLLGLGLFAAPPGPGELIRRLDASSAGVRALSGSFIQKNRLKLFKEELRSTGRFYFQKPDKVRWEYLSPDPSVLVVDGNRATLSMPGAEAKVFDLEKDATMRMVFEQLLMWLGSRSLERAQADYELSSKGSDSAPSLVLVPKAESPVGKAFSRIELRSDPQSGLLRSLLLVEKNGDEKEIVFTELKKNPALSPDLFRIK